MKSIQINPFNFHKLKGVISGLVLLLPLTVLSAQSSDLESSVGSGRMIEIIRPDGSILELPAEGDVDGDGISNELERNGYFWDSDSFKMRSSESDTTRTYYITDPLQASSDQDPYSDYTEVSGVGLDVNVTPPDDHPLVAARPIISVKMISYDVFPLATISDARGGAQVESYSNSVTNSTTQSIEVTEGVEFGSSGLNSNLSVTGSYSETQSSTTTSGSSTEINWSNTRSTQPDRAARLELLLYLENTGSAEALDIVTTVNLKLGDKIIATFDLPKVDALNPGQQSSQFNVATANGGDITVTLDELKSLQLGTPLTLEVNQVSADVETLDNNNNQIVKSWNNFSGDINTVSVDIIATIGDSDPIRHQVFASWNQWDPQYTLKEVLSRIFTVEQTEDGVYIEGRRYPDEWYFSSPSEEFISQWEDAGRPNDILPLTALRNTKIVMNSPGEDSSPVINLASYSKFSGDESPYTRVLVSSIPRNFPISLVTSEIQIDGATRIDTLRRKDSGFYANETPLDGVPDGPGRVYVRNARGDVAEASITIPAIYKNAAEVKEYSTFLPNPGGNYWLYYQGDQSKPMLMYCQFFDRETGDSLESPREYLSFPDGAEPANFSDYSYDGPVDRYHFNKIRVDANTLIVDTKDTNYVDVEFQGEQPIRMIPQRFERGLYGKILYNPAFDTLQANIDLSDTPFFVSTDTKFSNKAEELLRINISREKVDILIVPENVYVLEGPTGVVDSTIQLVYGDYTQPVVRNELDGNALQLNMVSDDGFADAGISDELGLMSPFTIEAWVFPVGNGTEKSTREIILGREGEYQIARFPDGSIRYGISTSDSMEWKNSGYTARENSWMHFALVRHEPDSNKTELYIHDSSGKRFKGFLNSVQISDAAPDMNRFLIGGRERVPDQTFQGLIDELRIWNIPRSEGEIESTLGAVLSEQYYTSTDSGLVGYWRFDQVEDLGVGEPGVNDLRDYSAFANHGDLVGDAGLSSGIPVQLVDVPNPLPGGFLLAQNYPNPFNPETTIRYSLPRADYVKLTVYNSLGQVVRTLVDRRQSAGEYSVHWQGTGENGQAVGSGVYFYQIEAGEFRQSRRMILLK